MGIRPDLFHHVEGPDDVGVDGTGEFLVFERPVVFAVAKTLRIEAKHHAAIADVVQPIPDNEWRRRYALKRPIVRAAGFQLRVGLLPHELSVRFTESHKHTAIAALIWIAQQFVVCSDKHHPVGDNRIAVALRSQFRNPLDVLPCLDVPLARAVPSCRRPCCGLASRPTSASSPCRARNLGTSPARE